MLQEDSNGEASFEIIDKKASELSIAESLSSVSSAYSLPSPSLVTSPGGNLLSNVPPPTSLPDFTLWQASGTTGSSLPPKNLPPPPQQLPPVTKPIQSTYRPPPTSFPPSQQFPPTQFSAAIPPSKGVPQTVIPVASSGEPAQVNIMGGPNVGSMGGGGGFIGWMKEAVSSGGLLHKVAEKAKSSVDTIITTLDPQMTEYIYSGGDLEITVASQSEDIITLAREVFYMVFGKTWINGINTNLPPKDGIAIGLSQGVEYAEEKLAASLQQRRTPTVAIQEVLMEHDHKFYVTNAVLLQDADRNIRLQTFSQFTPLPEEALTRRAEKELPDYANYSSSKERVLAKYLQINPDWQELVTGVSRREILGLAMKCVVYMYKNHLDLK